MPAGAALIVTGHCYLAGASLSDLSERKILGGNLHALPHDLYPDDVAYVALGHLHRAQAVAGRETVRYSGSPLPLAVDEEAYPHQVVCLELEGAEVRSLTPLRVPRAVAILRLPEGGAPGTLEQVLAAVQQLPPAAAPAHHGYGAPPPLAAGAPVESLRIACVRIAEEHDLSIELAERPVTVEAFELLKPNDDRDVYLVYTRWASEEDFQAWLASPAFAHGHRPHGGDSAPVSAHSELWSFDVAQQEAPRG